MMTLTAIDWVQVACVGLAILNGADVVKQMRQRRALSAALEEAQGILERARISLNEAQAARAKARQLLTTATTNEESTHDNLSH